MIFTFGTFKLSFYQFIHFPFDLSICVSGNIVRMSDASDDMFVYTQLTDQRLFETVQHSITDDLLKVIDKL